MNKFTRGILYFSGLAFIACLVHSCANIANPTGGAYDFEPPKLIKVSPKQGSVNVEEQKFHFFFDENVALVEQNEKIIITPPQQKLPIIRSANEKITVTLRDSLIPNTTYTIDFTDAITDNNEGNVLENFAYSFSTGDHIDSLSVSGTVLDASNLEPVKAMYVGLHSNLSDSAFTKLKFERISRTNEFGKFTIKGVAPGQYRLYALNDINRDYKYDNPDEIIAYYDTIISPTTIKDTRNDTISHIHEDMVFDSIKTVSYTRFIPDNVLLRSFKSDFARKYVIKVERQNKALSIYFGTPTELPKIAILNLENDINVDNFGIMEKTLKNDTITYWMTNESILSLDTIHLAMTYLKTDSLNIDQYVTDTLKIIDRDKSKREREEKRREKDRKKRKKEDKKEEIDFLDIINSGSETLDYDKRINLTFGEPLETDLKEYLKLVTIKDSVEQDLEIRLRRDSLNPRKYTILNKWEYGGEYVLSLDSAQLYSVYGKWNNKLNFKFRVKKQDQYGNFAFTLLGLNNRTPAFVEMLNKSDSPVAKSFVKNNVAVFKNITPGEYYFRLIIDKNGNGEWDTGDYHQRIQPEIVTYHDKPFDIKSLWEYTEEWVVDTINLIDQKPVDILKNKPKDRDSRRKELEERENERSKKERKREDQQRRMNDPSYNMSNRNNRRR